MAQGAAIWGGVGEVAFCLPVKVRSFLRGCDGEDGWRSIADARAAADRDFPRPGAAETCGISNGSPARCCSYAGPSPVVSSTGEKCSRWAARRLSQTNLPGYGFLDFLFSCTIENRLVLRFRASEMAWGS
ncbi:prolactin receptor [Striga asiatica]|uniref:Prolactin receptor n=1 Tax=Striga asiatica TaxID=4170 RepID=A0A5A7QSS9_STRAF|nr:prolactin receptor [Striga asiatica]